MKYFNINSNLRICFVVFLYFNYQFTLINEFRLDINMNIYDELFSKLLKTQ